MKERQVEILPCPFCGANPCRIAEKREIVNTETGEAISRRTTQILTPRELRRSST